MASSFSFPTLARRENHDRQGGVRVLLRESPKVLIVDEIGFSLDARSFPVIVRGGSQGPLEPRLTARPQ
jgi:hypothetical protein